MFSVALRSDNHILVLLDVHHSWFVQFCVNPFRDTNDQHETSKPSSFDDLFIEDATRNRFDEKEHG